MTDTTKRNAKSIELTEVMVMAHGISKHHDRLVDFGSCLKAAWNLVKSRKSFKSDKVVNAIGVKMSPENKEIVKSNYKLVKRIRYSRSCGSFEKLLVSAYSGCYLAKSTVNSLTKNGGMWEYNFNRQINSWKIQARDGYVRFEESVSGYSIELTVKGFNTLRREGFVVKK